MNVNELKEIEMCLASKEATLLKPGGHKEKPGTTGQMSNSLVRNLLEIRQLDISAMNGLSSLHLIAAFLA
jgi:tryptophan 2,3-dioxygenase